MQEFGRDLQRDPRFADTTGSSKCEEMCVWLEEPSFDRGDFTLASDQRRHLDRQIVGPTAHRPPTEWSASRFGPGTVGGRAGCNRPMLDGPQREFGTGTQLEFVENVCDVPLRRAQS